MVEAVLNKAQVRLYKRNAGCVQDGHHQWPTQAAPSKPDDWLATNRQVFRCVMTIHGRNNADASADCSAGETRHVLCMPQALSSLPSRTCTSAVMMPCSSRTTLLSRATGSSSLGRTYSSAQSGCSSSCAGQSALHSASCTSTAKRVASAGLWNARMNASLRARRCRDANGEQGGGAVRQ